MSGQFSVYFDVHRLLLSMFGLINIVGKGPFDLCPCFVETIKTENNKSLCEVQKPNDYESFLHDLGVDKVKGASASELAKLFYEWRGSPSTLNVADFAAFGPHDSDVVYVAACSVCGTVLRGPAQLLLHAVCTKHQKQLAIDVRPDVVAKLSTDLVKCCGVYESDVVERYFQYCMNPNGTGILPGSFDRAWLRLRTDSPTICKCKFRCMTKSDVETNHSDCLTLLEQFQREMTSVVVQNGAREVIVDGARPKMVSPVLYHKDCTGRPARVPGPDYWVCSFCQKLLNVLSKKSDLDPVANKRHLLRDDSTNDSKSILNEQFDCLDTLLHAGRGLEMVQGLAVMHQTDPSLLVQIAKLYNNTADFHKVHKKSTSPQKVHKVHKKPTNTASDSAKGCLLQIICGLFVDLVDFLWTCGLFVDFVEIRCDTSRLIRPTSRTKRQK